MKKLLLFSVLIFSLSACSTQRNINQFYDTHQGGINTMSFKLPVFLAKAVMSDDPEMSALLKKIKSARVLTINDLNETRHTQVHQDLKSALLQDGFENWFNFNQDGRQIQVSAQNRGKSVKNVVVALQGSDNLFFFNAKTDLSENELTKIITRLIKSQKKVENNK